MGLKIADISETHHKIENRQVYVLAGIGKRGVMRVG